MKRKWILLFGQVLVLCLSVVGLRALASPESLDQLMTQWLNLESQRGKLMTDWNEREQQLSQKLTLLTQERQSLQTLLKNANQDSSEVDERRRELITEQDQLEREQGRIGEAIERAANHLSASIARMPPPLQDKWSGELNELTNTQVSLSKKLEKLLGVSKSIEQFDQRVAVHKTSMALPDGQGGERKTLVTQLYLGLSQGWYVSDKGGHYGYGQSSSAGWQWSHARDGAAGSVVVKPERLLKILTMIENPTQAEFVTLPISL